MITTITINHADGDKKFDTTIGVGDVALKKVLHSFNVTNDERVTTIKLLSAALIDAMLIHIILQSNEPDPDIRSARIRAAHIAITDMEKVQMALVKSLFALA